MSYRNSIAILIIVSLLISCKSEKTTAVRSGQLLEVKDLANLDKETLLFIDFRTPEAYARGHIPGAINIWRKDIEAGTFPYGGMMAKREKVEELLSKKGITAAHQLVLYDDRGLPDAARLWWVLSYYGFEKVSLLNGGLQAWQTSGKQLSTNQGLIDATVFSFPQQMKAEMHIAKDELKALLASKSENFILVDTRSEEEYSGKRRKAGAGKAGRIPQSVHIDWADAIDFTGTKRLKSLPELERIYSKLNATKDDLIVVYCHSGVRSSHTAFVLKELLGYTRVKNYDGSWTEWSFYEDLPFIDESNTLVIN